MAATPKIIEKFPLKQLVLQLRLVALATAPVLGGAVFAPLVFADPQAQQADAEFKDAEALEWVPLEKLTEEQRKKVPISCCGAYVPPQRTDTDAQLSPEEAPFHGYAEEQQTERQTRMTLTGNVAITQGSRSMTTAAAEVDKTTQQAKMTGGIQLREPNMMVLADSANVNMESGDATLDNARFVLYQTRIHGVARQLKRFGDNIINLEQSEISSCEPGDDVWSIRGSEITLHPEEHYGTAENMRINIKDIPVIYMPYVRFPVGPERLTGFLFPTFNHTSRNGWDTALPFYWNIAPEMDATITPRYMSERGPMLEGDVRNLSTHFMTEVTGSLINNDHGGYSSYLESQIASGALTPEEAYPYRGHNRWFANLTQTGGRGEAWSTSVNYTDLSDNDYLRDMYSGSVDSNRQAFVRQMFSADYRTENWFMGIKSDEYRLLTTTQLPYRELPRIHLNGNYRLDDWVVKLDNEYVNFAQNRYFARSFDSYTDPAAALADAQAHTIYGERINTKYSLTWDKSFVWGFVKPSMAVKSLSYELDQQNLVTTANAAPSFIVPQASLDAGLNFERDAEVFGDNYLQTLEPRLFYFYSSYKNQESLYGLTANTKDGKRTYVNFDTSEMTFNYDQLFRTTRFAGGDRLDDANQVSLAVSSAFIAQDTGIERLRVSLGQIFYANDRKITSYDSSQMVVDDNTRSSSDWVAQARGQVGQRLHLSGDVAYDQNKNHLDNAEAGLHYLDESYRIFNLTYRYTLKPIAANPSIVQPQVQSLDQIDASMVWPINSRWSLIARRNHDFTYGVELDTFAGFEYNDCCYRMRVIGRRWLRIDYRTPNFLSTVTNKDYEPSIMLELELKGLGSMDKRIGSLLDKAVTGFSERDKYLR